MAREINRFELRYFSLHKRNCCDRQGEFKKLDLMWVMFPRDRAGMPGACGSGVDDGNVMTRDVE